MYACFRKQLRYEESIYLWEGRALIQLSVDDLQFRAITEMEPRPFANIVYLKGWLYYYYRNTYFIQILMHFDFVLQTASMSSEGLTAEVAKKQRYSALILKLVHGAFFHR